MKISSQLCFFCEGDLKKLENDGDALSRFHLILN